MLYASTTPIIPLLLEQLHQVMKPKIASTNNISFADCLLMDPQDKLL